MPQELSADEQRELQQQLAVVQRLLKLESTAKHDTRFDNEVAVLVPIADLEAAIAIVEERFGAAIKPAGERATDELASSPMVAALGGLRGAQTLYVEVLGPALCVYVALWPWGSGKKITFKIGVSDSPP